VAYLLRQLRQPRWWQEDETRAWLPIDDAPADVFKDLVTEDNTLSVWHIDDQQSNLDRLLTALAASRHCISNLDYLLCEEHELDQCEVTIVKTEGATPDSEVNARWHRDLIHLSANRLLCVAQSLFRHGVTDRTAEKKVKKAILEAVSQGHIDRERLAPNIQKYVV
jgi:hypothetical protein